MSTRILRNASRRRAWLFAVVALSLLAACGGGGTATPRPAPSPIAATPSIPPVPALTTPTLTLPAFQKGVVYAAF